jgi:carbohydrate-binding DOMON domain-containing protein
MKLKKVILPLGICSLLAATGAQALTFNDPKGDDYGPGNYIYPTDAVYKKGSFDLTKLVVKKSGDNVEFAASVNSKLEDPWGMGVGFSVQMFFIFIDNKPGGHTEGLPGTNVQFAPGNEWDKVVVLSPQKKARVLSEAKVKAADVYDDIVVPNITRGSNRTVKGKVKLSELGGGNPDDWGYQVVMQSNEGFPAEGDFLTRKVNEYEGQHRWGNGNDGDCDPHVMDVLESPDASQKDQLAYECGDEGQSIKKATLKMIRK